MQTLAGTVLRPHSPTECRILPNMVMRIGDDGKIAELSSASLAGAGVIGGESRWIIPGFIDAHLHVPQWDRRGVDGLDERQWREMMFRAEARMSDVKVAEKIADEFALGMIAHGTTTSVSFGSPFRDATDKTFEVFSRRGIRAVHGMMLSDTNCPGELAQDPDEALDQAKQLASKWHGADDGRLAYAFSPRSPLSCSEKMLRGAAALSQMLRCYLQTNVAESLEDESAVRDAYPDSVDDLEIYAEMGMLTSRTLLGHGVFLTRQQRDQVARSGTTLVHCPTANLFMEYGMMDYVAHRSAGTRIALGSSIASGPDPFMPRVAIVAIQTAKALKVHAIPRRSYPVPTPAEAWWMMTRGAAEALNMGSRIGSLDVGYEADCLVVKPEAWIAELPPEQQASALLYTLEPSQIEHVFVAGRRVGPN